MTPVFDADQPKELSMQFKPKTDEQLAMDRLLPAGEYDFQVSSAVDAVSKNGNPMIAIELQVFTPDGNSRVIKDWLMESMAFKLKHFAYGTGMGPAYEAGEFSAEQCVGRAGKVILKVEQQEGFGPRNSVKDYVGGDAKEKPAPHAVPAAKNDDSVPF